MSEVLNKSEAQPASTLDPRALQWSPLYRVLAFLAAAEPYTTPVHSAMACASSTTALVLSFTVWGGLFALAVPLSIVGTGLMVGTITKSWMKARKKKAKAHRRATARLQRR